MARIIKKNITKQFFVLLLLTPVFWSMLFRPLTILNEWQKLPVYFNQKINSIFSQDKLRYVIELRWEAPGYERSEFFARLSYNKLTVLVDEFFSFLTFFSPRLYFQAGDGGAIPALLFPFWIFGILSFIQQKRWISFLVLALFGALAFLINQQSLGFLFPVILVYLYFVNEGINVLLPHKRKIFLFAILIFYISYIAGRWLWL